MVSIAGMLLGGYAFIVVSYAFVWVIASTMSHYVSAEHVDRITKADVKAVSYMFVVWTLALASIMIIESCR